MPKPPIQLKRSGTASATPSSLEHGELALNYADSKVFFKNASNTISSFTFQSYALASHTHAASDITSGTLDAARLPLATTIAAGAVIVGTGLGVSSGTVSVTYGTSAGTACQGNDSRLSDTRTPTDGSVTTAKIANDAVTYAKIQNVSATDRLLGRSSAGSGDVEEVTCTAAGRALLSGADAAAQRTTLSVQPTASPAFTGAATFDNTGNVVPLTITNTGTANSFVVNDASGDPTPFVIDASGNVGIKATSTASSLNVVGNSAFYQDANGTPSLGSKSFYAATFENFSAGYGLAIGGVSGATGACIIQVQSFTISAAYDMLLQPLGGNVGIGTTAPSNKLSVSNAGAEGLELIPAQNANESRIQSYNRASAAWNKFSINCSTFEVFCNGGTSAIAIATTAAVTLGGQLLVTAGSASACGVAFSGDTNTGLAQIGGADTASLVTAGVERVRVGSNGRVQFFANSEKFGVQLNNGSTGNGPFIGSDGADIFTISTSGGAERVRVDASGNVLVGQFTTTDPAGTNTNGVAIATDYISVSRSSFECLRLNIKAADGTIVALFQDATLEGSISVAGNTVSYNAFCGSHWAQLIDGSRPAILRGTVLETIDEMCEWPEGKSERLARVKVSDTPASRRVYGVFMAWDEEYASTGDLYATALGAYMVRVSGVVQSGDLLESAGDGTARTQPDDIVRSSTIGKVSSTHRVAEYDDGSYLVPCVLMCG